MHLRHSYTSFHRVQFHPPSTLELYVGVCDVCEKPRGRLFTKNEMEGALRRERIRILKWADRLIRRVEKL